MHERDESAGTVVELLLREPEIVAWLGERAPEPEAAEEPDWDDEPPRAA